jgi:DNA-binding response OmpR family regulator
LTDAAGRGEGTNVAEILVVEDDAAFLNAVASSLKDFGSVNVASSAGEAIAQLDKKPIGVLVTDFKLGDRDGNVLAAFAKNLVPSPVVILITAFANKSVAIDALNCGVFGLLEKPFELADLRAKVQLGFEEFQRRKQLATSPFVQQSNLVLIPADLAVACDSKVFRLTQIEYEILAYLLLHQGSWVSRSSLEAHIWKGKAASRNILDTHLTNLKKKVPALRDRLASLRGRGFTIKEN